MSNHDQNDKNEAVPVQNRRESNADNSDRDNVGIPSYLNLALFLLANVTRHLTSHSIHPEAEDFAN